MGTFLVPRVHDKRTMIHCLACQLLRQNRFIINQTLHRTCPILPSTYSLGSTSFFLSTSLPMCRCWVNPCRAHPLETRACHTCASFQRGLHEVVLKSFREASATLSQITHAIGAFKLVWVVLAYWLVESNQTWMVSCWGFHGDDTTICSCLMVMTYIVLVLIVANRSVEVSILPLIDSCCACVIRMRDNRGCPCFGTLITSLDMGSICTRKLFWMRCRLLNVCLFRAAGLGACQSLSDSIGW